MTDKNEMRVLHIVMYPWFAISHLTSFLRLANKLAQRGHKISYFIPTKTQAKLAPHNHRPHLITFFPVDVPHVDGLSSGAETTNDVPLSSGHLLVTALELTRDTIDFHLSQLKPDYVLFDFAYWLPELARKHGAKSMYYSTSNIMPLAYINAKARNLPDNGCITDDTELMRPPPGFPCPAMGMHAGEAQSLARIRIVELLTLSLQECDAIGSKTCREMEGPYCDYLEKYEGKPVILAGPMVPEPPAGELDKQFDEWLKGFSKDSVVYCALGSECCLGKELFQELVLGLELTGRPFLAALKLPMECETLESALPEGFLERTTGRGIVHNGWVQQPLLLQHPSMGCFVTHCGTGSLSEAILSDCQLVLLPQAVDQFINARFMSMELRVGIEIEKREDDSFFTRDAVCEAISKAMGVESEVGKEVRANHAKWREMLLKEGLEESYICEFIRRLQGLL